MKCICFEKSQKASTCFASEHGVLRQLLEFSSAYSTGAFCSAREHFRI